MAEIINVAQATNTLLNLGKQYSVLITNLSLQKLIFFIEGFFYLQYDDLLFQKEIIEAWNFGPVIPDIYHQFKRFGRNEITELACYFEPETMDDVSYPIIKENSNLEAYGIINDTFALLAGKDAFDLVSYSHRENSPWKRTINKNGGKMGKHLKIDFIKEDKNYFQKVFDEVKLEYDKWEKEKVTLK